MKAAAWAATGSIGTLAIIAVGIAGYKLGSSHSLPQAQPSAPATTRALAAPTPTPVSHQSDCFGTWAFVPGPGSTKTALGVTITANHASAMFTDYSGKLSGKPKVDVDGSVRFDTSEGRMAVMDCNPGKGSATLIWDGSSYSLRHLSGSFEAFAMKNGLMGD